MLKFENLNVWEQNIYKRIEKFYIDNESINKVDMVKVLAVMLNRYKK